MTMLYHYCPMSSFLKIIESSFIAAIWLSQTTQMKLCWRKMKLSPIF